MLIMALIVLGIRLMKNIMNLLEDVLDRSMNRVDFSTAVGAYDESS
jgi:hypothetical protein